MKAPDRVPPVPLSRGTLVLLRIAAVLVSAWFGSRAVAQDLTTTYYPDFGAQTPTSPGSDSGGHGFSEYWRSSCGLFNLSESAERVIADEVLGDPPGDTALSLCLGERYYPPREGNYASCAFHGPPRFIRLRHSLKVTIDAQLLRQRHAACAAPVTVGLPQGFTPLPIYHRLFPAGEITSAGPVELRTQDFPSDCATSNQVYNRRVNITLANYGESIATFTVVAYPFRRFGGPYESVWTEHFAVEPRRVRQVNDVQIPRTITDYQVNRELGSMSVWLTITSDQPYLGYVSSVFEGGEPGSLPFQVFPLRGAEVAPSSP